METYDGQRLPIHRKPKEGLSSYQSLMLDLFYGNDVENVYTYYVNYHRPKEEDLLEWQKQKEMELREEATQIGVHTPTMSGIK